MWLAITKANLLRPSIHPKLVEQLKVGRDWDDHLRNLNPPERSKLAETIGVTQHGGTLTSDRQAPFERGQGSPFLTYAGRGDAGDGAFGGAELVRLIIDTLTRDMKEPTIG